MFGEEDYAKMEERLTALSQEQLEKGYEVSEFKIVYISPESIQDYLSSEEESTFFGYRVDDLVESFGIGTALAYSANGFQEAQILKDGSAGYDWKPFLIKAGIGCGIILVGAVLTPLTGGASFGCALVTISKVAVSFAFAASLEQLASTTVEGLIAGKDIKTALKDASHAGLDAFANGFMIGAAIGSVGVVTGMIKPSACFVAGTYVALGNSLYKEIEDVEIGDYVLSYNEETNKVSKQKVSNVLQKEVNQTLELTINNETIETTPNHPFYLPKYNCWVRADSLDAGDVVLSSSGDFDVIQESQEIYHIDPITVYNFTVDNNHTYFVGDAEILVHNACNKLSDREIKNYRNKAGKKAKKEALNDLIEGRNLKKWGFDSKNPNDMKVLEFIQKNKRYPSFKAGDGLQCDFAHAVDVNSIKKALNSGTITKQ